VAGGSRPPSHPLPHLRRPPHPPGAKSCLGLLTGGEVEVRVPMAGGSRPPSRPLPHLRRSPPRLESPPHPPPPWPPPWPHPVPAPAVASSSRAMELSGRRKWSSTGGGGGALRPSPSFLGMTREHSDRWEEFAAKRENPRNALAPGACRKMQHPMR
jgi:hypothetical protein